MKIKQSKALQNYMDDLLASGRVTFTRDDVQSQIGLSNAAFHNTAARLQKQKKLLSPRHGFYVIVPPQFYGWGAPPPDWYIDTLMSHEQRPYYVGLLKAAEIHGATHQSVMEYQVITDKQLPRLTVGRSAIAFYFRKSMAGVSEGVQEHKTDAGFIKLSSPELTALDLLRYPHAAGGINHIATVLTDLGKSFDPTKFGFLATVFATRTVQRLGYLLDYLGHDHTARHLLHILENANGLIWNELEPPARNIDPDLVPPITERDRRWRIIVRRPVEVDE